MHLMIDLETAGTTAGCRIYSIGAVLFDPRAGILGEKFYQEIDHASYEGTPFTVDPETTRWWESQGLTPPCGSTSIEQALRDFKAYACHHKPTWANSPSFDHNILRAAYSIIGAEPPQALHYPYEADLRTLRRLAGHDQPLNNCHTAVDDAINQAHVVIECYRLLRLRPHDPDTETPQRITQWRYQAPTM